MESPIHDFSKKSVFTKIASEKYSFAADVFFFVSGIEISFCKKIDLNSLIYLRIKCAEIVEATK